MITTVLVIVVSLLFSAFFSGMEIAFLASNKLRIEIDRKQGTINSRFISFFSDHPSQFISTMLVGNNISLSLYGIYMARLMEPVIVQWSNSPFMVILLQTCIATMAILVLGEFLPKLVFRIAGNQALKFFAFPLVVFYYLFYPLVVVFVWLSATIIRLFTGIKIHKADEEIVFGKIDINTTLNEYNAADTIESDTVANDIRIFQNALDFSNIKLRECMVPRTELCVFPVDGDIQKLSELFISSGYSKILLYRDNIDDIIGYVHVLDMFRNAQKVRNILKPVLIVPESMPAYKLLEGFIGQNKSIAVVVDEFGGTSGVVTIEDLIEEIFGEIDDEFDVPEFTEKKISDNEYIFSARLEIDVINSKYGLSLSESYDYETLAGYILFYHGDLPAIHAEIEFTDSNKNRVLAKILKADNSKIELVLLRLR